MSRFTFSFSNKGSIITPSSDLVSLGILPKQISEYTDDDIGSTIFIPYKDESGKIMLLNDQVPSWRGQYNGNIDFEVVGVNHHKDINDESKPTITLMTRRIIRRAPFDAREPNNPNGGNNRWAVSNIRQWLNSEGAANEWFTPQHEYDTAPDKNCFGNDEYGEHVDEIKAASYAGDPGFLAGFSSDIKQHLATVRNKTLLWDYDKDFFSQYTEETEDKVFLPSLTETGYLEEPFIQEGIKFIGESRAKELYSFTSDGFMPERGFYWLRTPYPGRSSLVYVN